MLGTESGASVCDFTGAIQRNVEAHVQRSPDASFETLRDLYFKEEDGRILMNVISPRCFEAAALRTLMILYEGDYSGVLEPWRHYVPLRRDHGNMDEVVRVLRDPVASQEIVNRAHEEIALNPAYTFRAMVEKVDGIVEEGFRPAMAASHAPYSVDEFAWHNRKRSADATDFASVESTLPFQPDAPLANILADVADKQAATSLADAPLPHVVEMKFDSRIQVRVVRLVWADEDAMPLDGAMTLFAGEDAMATTAVANGGPEVYGNFSIEPSVSADRIQIRIDRYRNSNRLRLRDLRVEADEQSVRTLTELRHRRFWIRRQLMYVLSRLWMHLPDGVKAALRPPARVLKWLLTPASKSRT